MRWARLMVWGAVSMVTSGLGLSGCSDEEDWSNDANIRLEYSTDSVKFEPLITGVTTSTRTVKIYNHSGSDLKVERIYLDSPGENFQLNVDGRTGTDFRNVEIKDGDSVFVFVRAQPAEADSAGGVYINDRIVVCYNGNEDAVVLNAFAQNAIWLKNYTIDSDTTWMPGSPFLIFDTLRVAEGARLTIKQGTEILFHNGASMVVDGSLDIRGTVSAPVLLSGDRYDNLVTDVPYTRLPGQWTGIHFGEKSSGNLIEGAVIVGMDDGIVVDSAAVDSGVYRLVIGNCLIRTSNSGILTAECARIYAYNSVLANGGYRNVYLDGGDYLFNHCTLARFNDKTVWPCVMVSGSEERKAKATFNNCIIYGGESQEIGFDNGEGGTDVNGNLSYVVRNCLVSDVKFAKDSVNFVKCVRGGRAGFEIVSNELKYNFRPDSSSAALGIGDASVIGLFPECALDLDAGARNVEKVDAGAYNCSER